jgi:3-hydroxyisobutyrate dehydrogenase
LELNKKEQTMAKIAFIGLGVMGYPMAGHLQSAGHSVTVYNRTAQKAEKWVAEYGGTLAPTPSAAAEGQEVVFSCVGNDDDLRQVTTGPGGAFHTLPAGGVFVDHTTASADVAQELAARAQEKGFGFMDAPVSGGQVGAEKGQLTIMAGGETADYKRVEPIMQAYFKQCVHMGPVGSGQLTKMANQVCIAGVVQGLAEGLHLAQKAGLDVEKAVRVMQEGSAGSWFMTNRALTMHKGEYDFGFAVDWMRKDLGIALAEAEKHGAKLALTKQIDQYFAEVQEDGHGRWDVSSLMTRLTK